MHWLWSLALDIVTSSTAVPAIHGDARAPEAWFAWYGSRAWVCWEPRYTHPEVCWEPLDLDATLAIVPEDSVLASDDDAAPAAPAAPLTRVGAGFLDRRSLLVVAGEGGAWLVLRGRSGLDVSVIPDEQAMTMPWETLTVPACSPSGWRPARVGTDWTWLPARCVAARQHCVGKDRPRVSGRPWGADLSLILTAGLGLERTAARHQFFIVSVNLAFDPLLAWRQRQAHRVSQRMSRPRLRSLPTTISDGLGAIERVALASVACGSVP